MNKYIVASLAILIALAVWLTPASGGPGEGAAQGAVAAEAPASLNAKVPLYQFLDTVAQKPNSTQPALHDGHITYAENGSDFATLRATLTIPSKGDAPAVSILWIAKGRLTADDLKALRAAHFDEAIAQKDAASAPAPANARRALLREITVNTVYIALFVGAILFALPLLQKNLGTQQSTIARTSSKAPLNATRFTHVAGCD
ncbi:MAG TPA: hypothetical protein VIM69_05480, partial [Opitutaceae bacterium]